MTLKRLQLLDIVWVESLFTDGFDESMICRTPDAIYFDSNEIEMKTCYLAIHEILPIVSKSTKELRNTPRSSSHHGCH